jgi:hypothetical protein
MLPTLNSLNSGFDNLAYGFANSTGAVRPAGSEVALWCAVVEMA